MNDGTLGIMNMDTGAVTPATLGGATVKGKPTAFAEKQAAAKVQLQKDLTFAITEIGNAIKEGGLIDQSTGSGAGRLADISMGFVGQATPGAIAIGKLQPIADLPLKLVPRFEGPQSNADLKTYQQASAQLADPTLPRKIRKAAGATIVRLMKERQGQFATKDMAPTVENAAKADPNAEAAAYLKTLGITQ
jgi:ribosomal protein S11